MTFRCRPHASGAGATLALAAALAAPTSCSRGEGPPPAAAAATAAPDSPVPAGPHGTLVFDAAEIDLGEVLQWTETKRRIAFRNAGNGPLRILGVVPGCSCTVATPEAGDVPPGGTGGIDVTFHAGNQSGPQKKFVTVNSTDPARPSVLVAILAKVSPVFVFEPADVDFGVVARGDDAAREVAFRDAQGKPFTVASVTASHPDVRAELLPEASDAGGVSRRLRVALRSTGNPGPVNAEVTVTTDRPGIPPQKLLVRASLQGRVTVNPAVVFMGAGGGGRPFAPQYVWVQNSTKAPIELTSVETGVPWLTAAVNAAESKPGFRYRVDLAVDPAAPPGRFEQRVKIATSEPGAPLEVAVSGVVRKLEGK